MNVVLIQHSEQQPRKYCFAVPDSLLPNIQYGADVICDTRRGHTHGRVVSEVLIGEAAERMIADNGTTMPLKNILAVVENIAISDIRIPIWMEMSEPRRDKIDRRKQELRTFGCVKTKVRVGEDGILQDGYTAYLVCKNKGMDAIPVVVMA